MFARSGIPYSAHIPPPHLLRRGKPDGGRNMVAAFFGLVVTGLFSVAMAEPNWFKLSGGHCRGHLGMYPIFGFRVQHIPKMCFTRSMLVKLQLCFVLCLLGMMSSMLQFTLDVCGVNRAGFNWIRRNSLGNVVSVLLVVAIMSLCYLVTVDVSQINDVIPVTCSLDAAFYLIVGAGVAAVVAVTLSLLDVTCERRTARRRYGNHSDMQLTLVNEEALVANELVPPPVYQE